MIFEFSIENTFSISERETLSFEAVINDDTNNNHCIEIEGKKILKLMCLYGANASGKTKLLEALDFYIRFIITSFNELSPNSSTNFIPFKFDQNYNQQAGRFELIFYIKDNKTNKYIRYDYVIELTKKEVKYESLYYAPKRQKKLIFERKANNHIKWGNDIVGEKKIVESITRPNCSIISSGAQVQIPLIKSFYDELSNKYKGGIDPNTSLDWDASTAFQKDKYFKEKVVQLLSASDMGNIIDIDTEEIPLPKEALNILPSPVKENILAMNEKPTLKKISFVHQYNDKTYKIPLSKESAGTQKMMEMSIPLNILTNSSSILLIDELETSFHQELVEMFLQIFIEASENSQLIFSTHNQDLLDSGLLRDDEVWFCYKTPSGNSKYNSITDYKGIRKNVSRKKLYKADKFGALPNININALKELFFATKDKN